MPKKILTICLMLAVLLFSLPSLAEPSGSSAPEATPGPFDKPATVETPAPSLRNGNNSPVLMGYSLSQPSVVKGNAVTIRVSVKHTDVTARSIGGRDNLDITRLVDSFSGGSVIFEITSGDDDMLTYDVTFVNVKYTGVGKTLRFMSGYKDGSEPFSMMELTIVEAVEYEEPKPEAVQPNTPDAAPAPMVLISRSEVASPIKPGQEIELRITFQNLDNIMMTSSVATFTPSDSLMLSGGASSFRLGDIPGKKSASVTIRVKAMDAIANAAQSLNIEVKFNYFNNVSVVQGSASDRIAIPAVAKAEATAPAMESSVPNIVIESYGYGEASVPAGGKFALSFSLMNTGKLRVENIVVTVDGGDSFTMDGSTNTFFYDRIASGESKEQSVDMQALASAKTGAQTISVNCKYEYVDSVKRSTATAEIKLSVPVFQPDRFEVKAPQLPETVTAGEEVSLTLPYVNKGKAEVSNVEAVIDGDVTALSRTQYLGNFESGKSGNVSFVFTPDTSGEKKLTLRISYEDANQQVHTLEFPVTLNVQEMMEEPMDFDPELAGEETGGGAKPWIFIAGGCGLLVLLALGFGLLKKRKKKNAVAAPDADWDAWSDDTPSEAAGDTEERRE